MLNRLYFMDAVVISHEINPVIALCRITALERVEQIPKEGVGFALSEAVVNDTGADIPTSSQILFLE